MPCGKSVDFSATRRQTQRTILADVQFRPIYRTWYYRHRRAWLCIDSMFEEGGWKYGKSNPHRRRIRTYVVYCKLLPVVTTYNTVCWFGVNTRPVSTPYIPITEICAKKKIRTSRVAVECRSAHTSVHMYVQCRHVIGQQASVRQDWHCTEYIQSTYSILCIFLT